MSNPIVQQHFNEEAAAYATNAVHFIPRYHEQNALLMDLLPFEDSFPVRVLDLGAGPGVLSALLLAKYPNALLHVFDVAENMISAARDHLAQYVDRITFQRGDFSADSFGDGYHLVLSGLSIHHLEDAAKKALFRRLWMALQPGGMLLIRDIVLGESPSITALYENLWRAYIRSEGVNEQAVLHRYHAEDIPAGLEAQLAWLREAGFTEVGCHWKHLNFAIFSGRKPE
jgi:tRNA (cmo5U34)-methyltransferase